jgi:hypothetical protein
MLVYVINMDGTPLMPCKPAKAKHLLKQGKAKVIRTKPFTIKLLWNCENNTQEVVAGMDTGSKTIGTAAITNGKVVYQAETTIRNDVSKKMQQRSMYRRTRRGWKCRYRPARWRNRANSCKSNRLPPSIRSKVESHLREKKQVEAILPVSTWKVETASFDIHKITTPNVSGDDYQNGCQKDYYNVKAYVLDRDNYKCQSKRKVKHSKVLNVHHLVFRSNGGSNAPSNLLTLCKQCHDDLHANKYVLKGSKNKTKHATEVGIVKSQLKKVWTDFIETFGYETKYKREQLGLSKTHYNDAIAICCEDDESVDYLDTVIYKRHVCKGDFQQYTGKRSEKKIPTGKLFGLKKFDYVNTIKGCGFIKGKRSSGYFALMDIFNKVIVTSVNVKTNCDRVIARSTTLLDEIIRS